MNLLRAFVPENYRDLLAYISPAALSVIDWRQAAAQFGTLSKDLLNRHAVAELAKDMRKVIPEQIDLSPGSESDQGDDQSLVHNIGDLSPFERKAAGEIILDIYFSQFFLSAPVFLDLRLARFAEVGDQLTWRLSPLRHQFSDTFRKGMLAMYEGFYIDRPDRLDEGMRLTGIVPKGCPEGQRDATKELVFAHFGSAATGDATFRLEKFRQSFHELFLHLKKHKIRLPADFLFLGVYLATLYAALEKLDAAYNVRGSFNESWDRNGPMAQKIRADSPSVFA